MGSPSHSWTKRPRPIGLHEVVDATVGLQEQRPGDCRDDLGEHVRREDDQPERGAPGEAAVEQQRQAERDRQLDEDRERGDRQVVLDRAAEDRVLEGALVVVEADEAVERLEAVPVEEAVVGRHQHRDDDEDRVDDQRGGEEGAELEASAPTSPTLAVPRRVAASGRRPRRRRVCADGAGQVCLGHELLLRLRLGHGGDDLCG